MNERLIKIFKHPVTIPVSVGLASFAGGVAVGFFLGRRDTERLEVSDQLELDFGPKLVKDLNEDLSPQKPFSRPEPVIIDEEVIAERRASIEEIIPEEPEPEVLVRQSVFAENDDDWDQEEEEKKRSTDVPYILHKDEFYSDERGYHQITLTYYAGDNIMADEEDVPVYNHEQVVGPLQFGHGSDDPNVFYVRNDKRKAEYEIINNTGLFSVEVLGLEIENNERVKDLKHSRIHRFRPD